MKRLQGQADERRARILIRPARVDDLPAIEAIVREAYSVYLPRMGKPPGPILDDHGLRIAHGQVLVAEGPDGVAGLLVLIPSVDHLLLHNVAVAPAFQGRGLGRALVARAEDEARRLGLPELRLYTHVTMVENIALYARIGFSEMHRALEEGYERVFMRKRIITPSGA